MKTFIDDGAVLRSVASDVDDEIARQDAKWGQQNHPDGTGAEWIDRANLAREDTDAAAEAGQLTWLDVLKEEVFEAFAESDPEKLKAELIQVAAVAEQWVAAIERREARVAA
jgi:hypothetical protein